MTTSRTSEHEPYPIQTPSSTDSWKKEIKLVISIPISKIKSLFELDSYNSGTERPYLQLNADY